MLFHWRPLYSGIPEGRWLRAKVRATEFDHRSENSSLPHCLKWRSRSDRTVTARISRGVSGWGTGGDSGVYSESSRTYFAVERDLPAEDETSRLRWLSSLRECLMRIVATLRVSIWTKKKRFENWNWLAMNSNVLTSRRRIPTGSWRCLEMTPSIEGRKKVRKPTRIPWMPMNQAKHSRIDRSWYNSETRSEKPRPPAALGVQRRRQQYHHTRSSRGGLAEDTRS